MQVLGYCRYKDKCKFFHPCENVETNACYNHAWKDISKTLDMEITAAIKKNVLTNTTQPPKKHLRFMKVSIYDCIGETHDPGA